MLMPADKISVGAFYNPHLAEEILAASRKTGIRIHSVMNMDHWKYPLSSANQADVDRS